MRAIAYDGITFSSLNVGAGWGSQGQGPYRAAVTVPRAGGSPLHAGMAQDAERVFVVLTAKPGYAGEATIVAALGALNVLSNEQRSFEGLLNDGVTSVFRDMAIETWRWVNNNQVEVTFVASDPVWTTDAITTDTESDTTSPFQLALTNDGDAPVHPKYRLRWVTQRSSFGTVVGQKYRRRVTITNTQDHTLGPFPYLVPLGDTASYVSGGKAQSDGDDLIVTINGESLPRELIGWNKPYGSGAWIVVPGMDAGEALAIDVYYGNTAATDPPEWTDPDPTKPVIDMYSESGTATGGSTTTVVKAAAGWDTNRFYLGTVTMLTGTAGNIGVSREIASNTSTTITVASAFPSAVVNTDTFLISMSNNARWIYATRESNRDTDFARGRHYLNSATRVPSDVSYEAPGSWNPELVFDNRDSFGIKRYSMLDVGGGDYDPFALCHVYRMWEGNDARVPQAGSADGMSITTPVPIDTFYWEYWLKNPNQMVQAWVGVRASGAEDWAEAYDDNDRYDTLNNVATQTIQISSVFGDVYQLYTGLAPANDIEIDLDWRRDTGSATSGSTTTVTDTAKEWSTDQFDNGKVRMLSGANAGRTRGITANTSTQLTHSSFPTANADGDRYVVINSRLQGELRDADVVILDLDSAQITTTGIGSETEVYELSAAIWVGDGPAGDPAGQHRALIGWAGELKRTFISAPFELEIDAAARRIRIYETATEEYNREITDPEVIIQYHDGTAWRRSADWLPLGVGNQSVWVQETNMGELEIAVLHNPSFLGV